MSPPGTPTLTDSPTLAGHPTGLFTLFFAEMWERFSFYGMRALLILYMTKGFLGYDDKVGYTIMGAYAALVYMTPLFGGILADRLLGARRAVVLGGVLMAAGHLMMTWENTFAFFTALALLICGNGFFKPNISTIVGTLYPKGSAKRDGGFTIFYMGVNLGAAIAPLLCGFVASRFGWHYGFGLATIGMLMGIAVFVVPTRITQSLILLGALAASAGLFFLHADDVYSTAANVGVGIALLISAVYALVALNRGGLPEDAGAPPDPKRLRRRVAGVLSMEMVVYIGAVLAVPVFALLVSGFAPLTENQQPVTIVPEETTQSLQYTKVLHDQLKTLKRHVEAENSAGVAALAESAKKAREEKDLSKPHYAALAEGIELAQAEHWEEARAKVDETAQRIPRQTGKVILAVFLEEAGRPAGLVLIVSGLLALAYLGVEIVRLDKVARERMYVILILTMFSMIFWAFFEQAGSSVNIFTDRNVDRVSEKWTITEADVGKTLKFRGMLAESVDPELNDLEPITQEQLGYVFEGEPLTMTKLTKLREAAEKEEKDVGKARIDAEKSTSEGRDSTNPSSVPAVARVISWPVTEEHIGMGVGGSEIPASVYQAVNPVFILTFGLIFTALWGLMAQLRIEPSTPVKFALGLAQLGLGFVAFWYGAQTADDRGMVMAGWLLLGYLCHTTGELCLSPVGLSMVTKLSPARLVSTVMGIWFLATSFSHLLASMIAQFTGVTEGNGAESFIPTPKETVNVYGDVYGVVALMALASAVLCLILSPLLNRWMHPEAVEQEEREQATE